MAAVSGFAGILVILKPEYLGWPMVSAVGFAFFLAVNSLLVRKLPKHQGALHGLFLSQMCALPLAGALAYSEVGVLTLDQVMLGFGSAICSVFYSLGCVIGYRYVASSQVSSAEYSGLLFAMLAGWALFEETPDWSLLLGAVLIIGPLVYMAQRDRKARQLTHHEEALS
jgi:drug/metabolite transporter (DMT)-like permease